MVQLMGGIRNGISLSINYTVRLEVSAIRLMRWYFRSAPSLSLNSLTILIITVPLHFLLIKQFIMLHTLSSMTPIPSK